MSSNGSVRADRNKEGCEQPKKSRLTCFSQMYEIVCYEVTFLGDLYHQIKMITSSSPFYRNVQSYKVTL